jgi:hypothetical protein
MPKRKQKREGRSEEKRKAEDISSSRERADLRRRDLPSRAGHPNGSLQVLLHRSRLTGLIIPVSLSL